MWNRLQALAARIRPLCSNAAVLRKLGLTAVLLAAVGVAFFLGRRGALSDAQATPNVQELHVSPASAGGDYGQRVVAYIYGNIPIYREELGEFLIARYGGDKLEILVNRRLVELACKAKGLHVTDAEIEAELKEDLRKFGCTASQFENVVLARFKKTLYEYKEDMVRAKLLLAKLVRPTIIVTAEDLQKAFEARYHEKVECRMIVLSKDEKPRWSTIWKKVAESEEGFREVARNQFIHDLGAQGGKVPPIHKHFGDERIEKEVFRLKDGEVSDLLEMPDGTCVIFKRDKLIPADNTKRMSDVLDASGRTLRQQLHHEITEMKVAIEIQNVFRRLREEARPQVFIRPQPRQVDLAQQVQHTAPPAVSPAADNGPRSKPPPIR